MSREGGASGTGRARIAPGALGIVIVVSVAACSESGTELSSAPLLASLTVAPLELSPKFSPAIHDYTIPCAPGGSSLLVAAEAVRGAVATIETPYPPTSVNPSAVTVNVDEDQAIVIDATSQGTTQQYWVRCLPHDFPVIEFTPHPDAGTRAPGWYLVGDAFSTRTEAGYAMVLDTNGTPVWYHRVSNRGAVDVERCPDGSISYITNLGYYGADPGAQFVVQTLEPWQSRSVAAIDGPTDEHELQVLPSGDVLVFSYPLIAGVDLTGLGAFGANATIPDCTIQELDATGALVWQWRASDHIDPVRESTHPESDSIQGVDVVDVFHLNSIDLDDQGNLLVSARDMDSVFLIERATGRIVWKMGGAAYSKDGARLLRIVDDPETSFNQQHDARFQPGGHVSLFDDHTSLPGVARGVEYALDLEAGTARMVWQYPGSVSALAMGSFRRHDDGSRIIGWGWSSNELLFHGAFTELDADGHDVLDMGFRQGEPTYRALKVPPGDFDVDVLRATAGRP